MAAHAHTDDGNLHHVGIGAQLLEVELRLVATQHANGALQLGLADREGQIGAPGLGRDVLHDHVDVDRRLGQGAENLRGDAGRSEEHTSELQSLMRISYAVFCLKQQKTVQLNTYTTTNKHNP